MLRQTHDDSAITHHSSYILLQNVSKILKCNSLKTSLVKRVLVFCWVHEIIVTGSGLIKRISEHASSKSKMIARFKNEFIKRESQSSIVYIIKTETKLDMLCLMQQRWAGYFGLISTLRANIYQSEIDFCWFNIDSYR